MADELYAELRERLLELKPGKHLPGCDDHWCSGGPTCTGKPGPLQPAQAISTLLDRCIALEGALEPFAVIAEVIDAADAEEAVAVHTLKFPLREQGLTVGDFQRARTTLSGKVGGWASTTIMWRTASAASPAEPTSAMSRDTRAFATAATRSATSRNNRRSFGATSASNPHDLHTVTIRPSAVGEADLEFVASGISRHSVPPT